jgi:hypothetical protein
VAAPKIEISQETRDMGTVPKGQVVEAEFTIHNAGGSDLVITDARPSCGCTVSSFDKLVKPGADGKVKASVDTKSFSGPISKSVLVVSNDPERPQMNLFVKAVVKPFVDVAPQQYVRFSVVKGDAASQDVVLISEEKGFKPTIAETAQTYVKAEITPAGDKDKIAGRPASQYKLSISVTPGRARGAPQRAGADHDRSPAAAEHGGARLGHRPAARLRHADHGQLRELHRGQGSDHAQHRRDEQQAGDAAQGHEGGGLGAGLHDRRRAHPGGRLLHGRRQGERQGQEGRGRRQGHAHTTDKDKGVIEIPLKGEAL